ncbi:inositol polyphosphate 1-phosphatase [Trichonephila clavata]|uniref:Inositol polyphosphate 1-phosphatase n=1 Tax=Trichonephila clavata TaxID=2740835 RepID=A0A8X6GIV0_TRICU|nr:inositol polyphosphate 1-phosphatase [Trichonephila clavata]
MASESILLSDLLQCLIECSQKAARIAQIFRDENDLFQLLVEEKSPVEKDKKVFRDFKTLADVLVQETIKKDVGQKFPTLTSNIQGEEQNSFQNSLGESILVELSDSEEDTVALLSQVFDGKDHIARSLATAAHSKDLACEKQYSSSCCIPADSIGIWIDPIDATAEFIQGKNEETDDLGIQHYGLQCVCVLIGAYELQSGKPILGVVNQPFYKKETEGSRWESKYYWSLNYNPEFVTSDTLQNESQRKEKVIVLSSTESKELQEIISTKYKIVHASGAGYKSLLVSCKKVDLYVLSQGTTHFWDTCGPHALLLTQGGGIVKFNEVLNATDVKNCEDLLDKQIKYSLKGENVATGSFRNADGFIAYRNAEDVIELIELLHERGYMSRK